MAVVTGDWAQSVKHRLGSGVELMSTTGGFIALLPCSVCHKEKEMHLGVRLPADQIDKKLQRTGWETRKNLVCPACVKTRPHAKRDPKFAAEAPVFVPPQAPAPQPVFQPIMTEKPMKMESLAELGKLLPEPAPEPAPAPVKIVAEPPAPAPAAKTATPSDSARKAHRAMMLLLEDFFDDAKGVYRHDKGQPYSDKRIADETGESEAYVRENREKWFGPLKEPEEIQVAMEEISALREKLAGFQRSADLVATGMQERIDKLDKGLQDTRRRNGWI